MMNKQELRELIESSIPNYILDNKGTPIHTFKREGFKKGVVDCLVESLYEKFNVGETDSLSNKCFDLANELAIKGYGVDAQNLHIVSNKIKRHE